MKAGSGWSGFSGSIDDLTIGVNGINTIFDFELTPPTNSVPMSAPDSVPAGLVDSLGSVRYPGTTGPAWVRSIVNVMFRAGATQSARTAAIAAIDGRVLGGSKWPVGEGEYVVQVPDTTASGISSRLSVLGSLPQVEYATPLFADTLNYEAYLLPNDGDGWKDWKVDPSQTSVSRHNWPLEQISAPLAWGCSVGDTATPVAVVDAGLVNQAVIFRGNAHPYQVNASTPPLFHDHGTAVAEVLGGRGDDDEYSTGVMWLAHLDLLDYMVDPGDPNLLLPLTGETNPSTRIAYMLITAAQLGAKVINISAATQWEKLGNPSFADSQDVSIRRTDSLAMNHAFSVLASLNLHPLMVFSAGNNAGTQTVDVTWNGFVDAARAAPAGQQYLFVGALNPDQSVWSGSNTGSLVDLYAPGDSVWAYGTAYAPRLEKGTSFAAPFVSGVGGLLASFDPNLSTAQIRSFILAGTRTPAASGGNKVLDAYGALKAAAKTSAGPMCGQQRIWATGGNIYVTRDSSMSPELLVSLGQSVWDMDVYHGGHTVEFQTGTGWGHITWTPTSGWNLTTQPDTSLPGGSWSSGHGLAHDLLTHIGAVVSDSDPSFNLETIRVYEDHDTDGTTDSTTLQLSTESGSGDLHFTWAVPVAYPLVGDTALVAVDRMRGTVRDSSYSCVDDRGITQSCHITISDWVPDTAFIYWLSVTNPASGLSLLRVLPDSVVYALAFSETDQTVVTTVGSEFDRVLSGMNSERSVSTCLLQVRNRSFDQVEGSSISALDQCQELGVAVDRGGATLSPDMIAPQFTRTPSRTADALSRSPAVQSYLNRRLARVAGARIKVRPPALQSWRRFSSAVHH